MFVKIWDKARPFVESLGFRLAVVLAIGLLPLMIVSVQRSQGVMNEALARSQAALVGETLQAVRQETILIEKSKAVALSAAQVIVPLLQDLDTCNAKMEEMVSEAAFAFIGFADVTGFVPCSSADEAFRYKLNENFLEQVSDPQARVNINHDSPTLETSAVFASHPVYADDDRLLGFMRVSFPHTELREFDDGDASGATYFTIKADQSVLTSSTSLEEAKQLLPQLKSSESISTLPISFERQAVDGSSRLYAVVPVVEDELYALASLPKTAQIGRFYLNNPALFPALMWVASLAVAWFATSLFVTRDITNLRSSMRDFADRRKIGAIEDFENAPGELQDLAESFFGMTEQIVRDEAQLEEAVHQKDVLLREVHHRVKNNLQLISSIMAMQMHQATSPDVKQLMRNLQDRINSIATVHHNLYQTSGQADVAMSELLETIVRQVVKVGASKDKLIRVTTDIDSMQFNPDQAVPAALFLTEALTNAMKYLGSDEDEAFLSVSLRETKEGFAKLCVENGLSTDDVEQVAELSSTGLGSDLMEAFAAQLGGEIKMTKLASQYVVEVEFPIEDLAAKDL